MNKISTVRWFYKLAGKRKPKGIAQNWEASLHVTQLQLKTGGFSLLESASAENQREFWLAAKSNFVIVVSFGPVDRFSVFHFLESKCLWPLQGLIMALVISKIFAFSQILRKFWQKFYEELDFSIFRGWIYENILNLSIWSRILAAKTWPLLGWKSLNFTDMRQKLPKFCTNVQELRTK